MAGRHVNHILCVAEPRGSEVAVEQLLTVAAAHDTQAIALIGELGDAGDHYGDLFRALGRSPIPVFWVPGPGDAPVERYLHEARNVELAFPLLRGVHGTAAYASGQLAIAGLGGEISDRLEQPREEQERLRYPRWEAEYRLKLLAELDYSELILLFWTPPAHKGRAIPGSDVVAELVGTYRPRLVVCGGDRGVKTLGRSMIVAPGRLADGHYAVASLRERTGRLEELARAAQ
jgi:hypothetical protein